MELHEIRYFLALSRTLNFTKAAEACNVSQPALTRAIHKLESELGGLLFSRERNNTHMTELGRLVEPHLREVVLQEAEIKQTAARFLTLEKASLTVGVMCTIAPARFVGFLGRFRADNPGIDMTLLGSAPSRLSELLVSGELDVAFMSRPDGFALPLQARRLFSERFVIACSASHRFAQRDSVSMSELTGEYLFARRNCEFQEDLSQLCREQGANLLRSYQSDREDWLLHMVAAGLGVCFLPEFTANFPGVIGCRVTAPEVSRDVCLVTMSGRRQSAPLAAFVDSVREYSWSSTTDS